MIELQQTTRNHFRMPVQGHASILRHLFTSDQMQGLREELAKRDEVNKAFPKGSLHALEIEAAVEGLERAGLATTAGVVHHLGAIARRVGRRPVTHVATYDVDVLRSTRPHRNQLAVPALRATVVMDGITHYRFGGFGMMGSHYLGETATATPGDVMATNDLAIGPEYRELTSIPSATGERVTFDFLYGPTLLEPTRRQAMLSE